jgi:hypothetical protein
MHLSVDPNPKLLLEDGQSTLAFSVSLQHLSSISLFHFKMRFVFAPR